MKLFIFLIAALFVGATTAQGNIPEDVSNIINNLAISANNFASNFANGVRAAVIDGLAAFQTWWNAYAAFPFFGAPLVSSALNTTVNSGFNTVRDAFANNEAIRSSIYSSLQNVYQQLLADYAALANATAEVYQCWAQYKPQAIQVLSKFINDTAIQSRPLISSYNQYVIQQNAILTANFVSHQFNATARCALKFFPSAIRSCKDQYYTSNLPAINATLNSYRTNVLTRSNETLVALDSIVQNNAQVARNDLQTIENAFETCVNNTLTTTVAP